MSAKKTTAEFIAEAAKLHDGKYDYAKTLYLGARDKVTITCPIHGDFQQFPTNHLRPCGCPGCTGEAIRKGRGFGTEGSFDIAAAKLRHGDKYDYSAVVFRGNKAKVAIGCPTHGVFLQSPNNHLRGRGCPLCAIATLRMTTDEFISKAHDIHGDEFDYSKVKYIGARSPVIIGCKIHGDFLKSPGKHLSGQGCPKCGIKRRDDARRFTLAEFIEKARVKHGDTYTYDKAIYTGAFNKIIITCLNHGDFEQVPVMHLSGQGCPLCAIKRNALRQKLNHGDFIKRAHAVHGDKYTYANAYDYSKVKLSITCPTHGDFQQMPNTHLNGAGCPKCGACGPSKPETELFNFIQALAPDAVQSDRKVLKGKEIDVFVPSKAVGFEFNGLYWHSEAVGTPMNYHQDKSDAAANAGVRLIHIFEDEWRDNRAWCESHIRNVLNAPATTIYARKCQVELAETASGVREFLETNHIQGFRGGRSVALRYEGDIVAAAVIAKTATGEIELARWCVKLGVRVVGGFSRVMAHIPSGAISFCDTGKYDGAGYEAAGWIKASEGVASYHYTDFVERKGRQGFQKHKLLSRGAVGDNEVELAASEGFYRIGGLRQLKFVKA